MYRDFGKMPVVVLASFYCIVVERCDSVDVVFVCTKYRVRLPRICESWSVVGVVKGAGRCWWS